ncbi:hypothetical protein ACLK1T_01300 [Escherichia coli]
MSDKYCHRAESHDAGDISFSDIFRGPASIFGGIGIKRRGIPCV